MFCFLNILVLIYKKSILLLLLMMMMMINTVNVNLLLFRCYMNSVVQVLFCLPEFHQRYSTIHFISFTHTRAHTRTHALTHAQTHAHTHSLTYARIHASIHARTHARTHSLFYSFVQFVCYIIFFFFRYSSLCDEILLSAPADPTGDMHTQMYVNICTQFDSERSLLELNSTLSLIKKKGWNKTYHK